MSRSPVPFCYPTTPHVRRHGPAGYKRWEPYRDWLRDEFEFCCVYCLRREVWDRKRAMWVVEHLVPREIAPDLALEYTNLVYACAACNSAKSARRVPDPCQQAYGKLVWVTANGEIHPVNAEGRRLIRAVALDEADAVSWRSKWISLLRALEKHAPELYRERLGFPIELPDLTGLKPPAGNTKPEGAKNCHHARRSSGSGAAA